MKLDETLKDKYLSLNDDDIIIDLISDLTVEINGYIKHLLDEDLKQTDDVNFGIILRYIRNTKELVDISNWRTHILFKYLAEKGMSLWKTLDLEERKQTAFFALIEGGFGYINLVKTNKYLLHLIAAKQKLNYNNFDINDNKLEVYSCSVFTTTHRSIDMLYLRYGNEFVKVDESIMANSSIISGEY